MSDLQTRIYACLRLLSVVVLLAVFLLTGCADESASLHEHDHHEPKHWPADMAEASDSIEARMNLLDAEQDASAEDREHTIEELQDLVEWAPEVAADTELSEEQWLPIYELSEAIRGHLNAGDVDPTVFASDFEKLVGLLREGHAVVVAKEAERKKQSPTTEEVTVDDQTMDETKTEQDTKNN